MYQCGHDCGRDVCTAENWRSCHICYITGDQDGRVRNGKSVETTEDSNSQGYIQEGAGGGNLHHEQSCSSVLLFSFPWGKKNLVEAGFDFCFGQSWVFHLHDLNQYTFCRVSSCSSISTSLITAFFWFLLLLHRSELFLLFLEGEIKAYYYIDEEVRFTLHPDVPVRLLYSVLCFCLRF